MSAILLSTNFIPACYILQKKTVWKDIPLFGLFKQLAKQMSMQTEQDFLALKDLSPIQRRQKTEEEMKRTL